MLSELTSLSGVSGDTEEVRRYIINRLKCPYEVDSKGNIIAFKKGKSSSKRLMAAAHMDEVGLIVSKITAEGFLEFKCVGGIDERVLVSKPVKINKDVSGVIGLKAVHLQSEEERNSPPRLSDLVIDIGAKDAKEAEKYVRIGDTAAFIGEYKEMGENRFTAKALDDRVGCECLLRLLEKDYEYDFYGVFSDCEEIGGIGAKCAAEKIAPDAALVLEGTTCSDTEGTSEKDFVTRLGGGACIPVMDRSMIADRSMTSLLRRCADENGIKWQYKKTTAGGTDGGVIHLAAGGIKCAVLALPVRYIHSPCSIADKRDLSAYYLLAEKFTERAGEIL